LFQIFEFFLLELHHSKWHMMRPEAIFELLPVDALWLLVGFDISISPIYSGTFQLVQSKQNLLTVVTLDHLPIICIHWFD
jgi:hypothetical protein